MNLRVHRVEFGSVLQIQSIGLRHEVLRKPLGLQFDAADLVAENEEMHIVAVWDNLVCGCILLKPMEKGEIKMRQVAVMEALQGKGIGKQMVLFCEQLCAELGYHKITLHARESAVPFYLEQHYTTEGERFTEVGIPHFAMYKHIGS